MRERLNFRVAASETGLRLERFLRERIPDVPARAVRFALAAGLVTVNGARSVKGLAVGEGDSVEVIRISGPEDWLPVAGDLPGASVLYRDDGVAVLDKPAGVHSEAHRPEETGTLAGYLRWVCPSVTDFAGGPGLSLLTRLDYATSGAVPAALSESAFHELLRQRDHGMIRKSYVCVVAGRLEREAVLPFLLDAHGGERVRVRTDRTDTDRSRWTVIEPLRTGDGWTLVQAAISRGKRHQIRAHLGAAGIPIVGDRLYGAVPESGPGHDRLLLHSAAVEFSHPESGARIRVESPVPEAFRDYGLT